MTVVNFNYPKFKYTIASTGQPGAGYKLFTYEEGTSTKKTTWTSLAKTAENTNPIILDANGEWDVWIDGNYKFVLAPPTDTDPPTSPIWTVDAIRSSDTTAATPVVTYPTNGSFETDTDEDGTPDSWTISTLSGGAVAIDSSSQSHGANSLKFTSSGSGAGSASSEDYYEVEAGKEIGVKFSIISANADTHNTVEVYWYNGAKAFLSSSSVYDDSATNPTLWTRKYLNATTPATAKYARIILTGVAADSATHSSTNFDNIELSTGFTGEITASPSELNTLDGITATTAELNYVDGVTSSIQTQLDAAPTTTSQGRIELATQAEVDAGSDNVRAVTPLTLATSPQTCKAWVTFDGTGAPPTINGSFNVTDITKTSTGRYVVNFTNALSSANYAAVVTCADNTGIETITANIDNTGTAKTTTALSIKTHSRIQSGNEVAYDAPIVDVVVF